jgi:type IX secretion system PorP/SprF family membrane protein
MLFNPAFTADKGASSLSVKLKSQWYTDATTPYNTGSVTFEESLPCSILDYGLKLTFDQEGDGFLKTMEAGALIVATPSIRRYKANHNFRIGADLSWGFQSIDYSRLFFSDQLDPQFGVNKPSKFIPPNDGKSAIYFNPGLGIIYKGLFNYKSVKTQMLNIGISIYNIYSLNSGLFSNSRSILGLSAFESIKLSAFIEYEVIPYYNRNNFVSVKPLVFYQKQGNIQSTDVGARVSLSKLIALGVYFHFTDFHFTRNTGWINLNAELGWKLNDNRRLDLSLSYCNNYSGLQNFTGLIFEFGIAYHFRKLTKTCGSPTKVDCSSFTSPKNKIYDNIWY